VSEPVVVAVPKQLPPAPEAPSQPSPSADVPTAKVAVAAPNTAAPEPREAVAVAQLKQPDMNQPTFAVAPVKTADLSQAVRGQYALDTTAAHSPTPRDESNAGATKPMSDMPGPAATPAPVASGCACGCPYGPGQSGQHIICGVDCGNCGAPCSAT